MLNPEAIAMILAFDGTDDTAPPAVVRAAHRLADHEHLDATLADTLTTWVADQTEQQSRAQAILRIIDRHHGVTSDPLVAGLPGWMGTWWHFTLNCAWSGRLDAAVVEAVAWLAAQNTPAFDFQD